jgi:glycosyltransferase involved in cell wall biosynthesis
MRVLHISAGNLYGGLETVLVTLARCRALNRELECEFAVCFAGRAEDELRAAGATVHRLGEVRVRWPLSILRVRRALRSLIEQRAFDMVICHSPWAQAIFGPVVHAAGLTSIFWLHDVVSGRHWLERRAARVVPDGAICDSRFTAATLPLIYPQQSSQRPRVPCEVVYYPVAPAPGVSQSDRAAVRAELGAAPEAVVVIQVSRMEEWKGHRLHLNALARLARAHGGSHGGSQWTCWIVGGGQRPHEVRYFKTLRAEAAALRIRPRVNFLGQRGDVARLLAAADIHCQPNTGPEPFGITFIEALYAGLPVVTTAIGGALEIVDSSCGTLVEPNDPAALAEALGRLIEDRELRARLGAAGPARAAALCDPRAQLQALTRALTRLRPGRERDAQAKTVEERSP